MGFILACTGHRYRAVAGSNPALPTILVSFLVVEVKSCLAQLLLVGLCWGLCFVFWVWFGLQVGCAVSWWLNGVFVMGLAAVVDSIACGGG